MISDELDSKVLGQLLLMQTVLINLPDNQTIFSFVCEGLLDLPGISKVVYSKTKVLDNIEGLPSNLIISIEINESFFGELILTISDYSSFKPYENYLNNFVFMIGVILEERKQHQTIDDQNKSLEIRVQERTFELNLEKENLIESQRRFTNLMENVQLLSVMIGVDGNITFCNHYFLSKTEYTPNELIGKNWFDMFLPKDSVEQVKIIFYGVMKGDEYTHNYENELITKSGKKLLIAWNNTVLYDENRQIIGTASLGEDITKRKQADLLLREKTDEIETQNEEYLQINEELNQTNHELIKARQKAEEDEEKFRLMIKNSNDAFVLIDKYGEQFYISDVAKRDTGFEIDELKGPIQNVIYPDDLGIILKAWEEILSEDGKTVRVQYRHIHKFKKYIWYEAVAQNFLNNPSIKAVVVNIRDITKIKEAEEELLEAKLKAELNELRFRAIFENSNDAIGISIEGISVFFNKAYLDLFGYTDDDSVIGKSILLQIAPKERTRILEYVKSRMLGADVPKFYETVGLKSDGREFPFEVTIGNYSINDENFTIAIIRDITERKLAELEIIASKEKIEESERNYKFIFESSGASNSIFDKNCVLIKQNKLSKEILGKGDLDGIGLNIFEIFGPQAGSIVFERMKRVLNTGISETFETKFNLHNRENWIKSTYQPVLDENKNIICLQVISHNITDIKLVEQELIIAKEKAEESDRLKTAFLQNMSHEIRTPLNAISGFTGMLNKPELSEDKRKSFVSIIQNSSQQLISIVSDILTISSLETQQEKLNINAVCMNDIMVELLSIFKEQATNKNISLYIKQPLTDEQSKIFTDKTKITQILTNLISNALKFTHEGFIEYGYKIVEMNSLLSLQFYVKDTGIGIKPAFHNKIFDRFRQAHDGINKLYGGTGLGLAISKAFIELLGGKIWVDSEFEKGSIFYFTIPYNPVNMEDAKNIASIKNEKEYTILVAEDEEFNFLFIEELLSDLNVKIIHSKDGQETVGICKSNPNISLILMDIKMPVMDGNTAAKLIKEFNQNMPIIAQSAYALEHEIEKYKANFDDYITKPISEVELLQKLKKYIDLKNEHKI